MPIPAPRPWDTCSPKRKDSLRLAWGAGDLRYKLHESQREVHAHYLKTKGRLYVLDSGRRWGKTYLGLVQDIEFAIKRPRSRIPVAAPEQKQVREILLPLMQDLLCDCPPDLAPTERISEGSWTFPNGSRIVIAGCDHNMKSLRGTHLDRAHVMEAAFIDDLVTLVRSVLGPQMQGRPWARLFMESTPPTTPLHPWSIKYVPESKASEDYQHRTIEDNPLLTGDEVREFNRLAGGRDSTNCRRENYAEHVVETELAIVPEFSKVKDTIACEPERPDYFDAYVSMDPGQVDLWFVGFAYYDFLRATVVIEDELVVNRRTTEALAGGIKEKEAALWGTQKPHLRVSDTELQVICDLQNLHDLKFIPTAKDEKLMALNAMRLWVENRRVDIHPRCTHLLSHLEFGVWNKRRTDYARIEGQGHFDGIDMLSYLVRNVNVHRNPYPTLSPEIQRASHFIGPKAARADKTEDNARTMFGFGGRKRRS